MIVFEMADLRFDRATTASTLSFGAGRGPAMLPGDAHVGPVALIMNSKAFVDIRITTATVATCSMDVNVLARV